MQWRCEDTSAVPRTRWIDLLKQTDHPSPYLLPEWGIFWETVWPDSRAELWQCIDESGEIALAVPLVRRRRLCLEMCHAQPNGTSGGPLGPTRDHGPDLLANLIRSACTSRTVEFCLTVAPQPGPIDGWTIERIESTRWVAQLGRSREENLGKFSDSHRRNIELGRQLEPRFEDVNSDGDLRKLSDDWHGGAAPSRIILRPRAGSALYQAFSPTDALLWRTAWIEDRVVASAIFLSHGTHAAYLDGVVDRDPQFRGVNHCLFADIFASLSDRGVTSVDLGSGPGGETSAGLEQFKHGWGALPHEFTECVYRRNWYHTARGMIGSGR